MHILPIFALAATVTASGLIQKRCSPRSDPDVAHGYYPPAPCWQTFDPACRPFLDPSSQMTLNAQFKTAVVWGVSNYCLAEVEEELARERDGRKNYGWREIHGALTPLPSLAPGAGILVIANMTDAAFTRYTKLIYQKDEPRTTGLPRPSAVPVGR
ncbi:hypothetical protein B0T18DRAFT_423306 [Schizothecium vesticola]|uniref:Uncharacterized protein n=1 Tax=Schizothecium vesticola TaxID=314040 RepID=A0AA40BR96_9PEZI|nr:hypothetical protein B0T18DRAFT_423306 [Schizothecium vesticola]